MIDLKAKEQIAQLDARIERERRRVRACALAGSSMDEHKEFLKRRIEHMETEKAQIIREVNEGVREEHE